ncbi:hypothetical protein [Streptomyces sp. NPDC001657]|uniref:hypothetical protein n=1 Tax=Streptomyces sp. NPDC001657 TaxID=3154522 RepID=UPI0033195B0E
MAHWGRTPLADGSQEDATGSRLTGPGIEALREMERLGMRFDISHGLTPAPMGKHLG